MPLPWSSSLPPADGPAAATPAIEVTITSGPTGVVASRDAIFTFSANEPATFACSLDGARPEACESPRRVRPGRYRVAALSRKRRGREYSVANNLMLSRPVRVLAAR